MNIRLTPKQVACLLLAIEDYTRNTKRDLAAFPPSGREAAIDRCDELEAVRLELLEG